MNTECPGCCSCVDPLRAELKEALDYLGRMMRHRYPAVNLLPDLAGVCLQIDNGFGGALRITEEHLGKTKEALHWIATVNDAIDLRKLDQKTLIGLIYELRGKAKAACTD